MDVKEVDEGEKRRKNRLGEKKLRRFRRRK
jgi:hypothetical protein